MKLITSILLLFSITLFSQQITQNVKGIVVDAQSEFPLIGAEVIIRVNTKDYWAITDENGEYSITNVPIGKITIQALFNGFNPQTYSQINLISGKELVVNFSLLEKLESLDEVVIQTKAKRESIAFVTTSAAIFNTEQTEQYAGTLNDVSRMAMNYAGVNANDDSRNDIIVRGNNPASLLWMIEGAIVPSPNHYSTSGSSGGPVSMLNINTLSSSNFLTGAFPANFGNTTSAAFDLHFKKPNNNQTEFVGQIGFAGAELGIEGPFSKNHKASYLFNYRYSTLTILSAMGLEMGIGTAVPKYQDINAVINFPSKNFGIFKFWAIAGISFIDFSTESEEDDNIYFEYDDSSLLKRNNNILTGMTHKYFFSQKTSSTISISYSNIDEKVEIDTLNTTNYTFHRFFDENLITSYTTVNAKINSKINSKNRLSSGTSYTNYGIDFMMNLSGTANPWQNRIKKNVGLVSAYINWQHRFTDNLALNSGLRYQFFTLTNQSAVEPRIGLKHQLSSKTSMNLAYGLHSNINPFLSYFTKQEIAPLVYEYANYDVGFVKSHHFIVGIDQNIYNKFKLKAELYYQYLFEVPISHTDETYSIINSGYNDPGGAQLFFDELFNEGKGKNYGLDLTLEYPLNYGFYTLFTGSLYESKYLAYDNKWRNTAWNGNFMFSLLTGKEFKIGNKSYLGIDSNLNFSGGRRFTPINIEASAIEEEAVYILEQSFEKKLANYFRTDLQLSYKLNGKKINQEWQIDLRNLFNRRNVFSQNYNISSHDIDTAYQQGFLPVMQYRILF